MSNKEIDLAILTVCGDAAGKIWRDAGEPGFDTGRERMFLTIKHRIEETLVPAIQAEVAGKIDVRVADEVAPAYRVAVEMATQKGCSVCAEGGKPTSVNGVWIHGAGSPNAAQCGCAGYLHDLLCLSNEDLSEEVWNRA